MRKVLFAVAVVLGMLIAYVDARPTWDDTGVTAAAVFVVCGVLGAMSPSRPWVWALAVGSWIPLVGILTSQNYAAILALVVAFVGAYGGMLARHLASPPAPRSAAGGQ